MSQYIEIPLEGDLAQAIVNNVNGGNEMWLVLKPAFGKSVFRSNIKSYSVHGDGNLGVDFETWPEYIERRAQESGI